jgi:hypothetical protein
MYIGQDCTHSTSAAHRMRVVFYRCPDYSKSFVFGVSFGVYASAAPNLSVHTVLPFIVATNITDSERNRPKALDGLGDRSASFLPGIDQGIDLWKDDGMPPTKVSKHLFDAISSNGDFYVYVDNVEDPDYCMRSAIKRISRMIEASTPEGLSGSNLFAERLMPRLMAAAEQPNAVATQPAAAASFLRAGRL